MQKGLVKRDKDEGDQSIDLLISPERINERVSIATSLIDNTHLATWGPVGIILEVPKERVIITSPSDLGSSPDLGMLEWQSSRQKMLNGDQL